MGQYGEMREISGVAGEINEERQHHWD